jgi:hypothetical protein
MPKGGNERWSGEVRINFLDASKCVKPIAVHRAGTTDSLTARASEGKSRIEVILDVEKGIQVHRWNFFEVYVVADVFGLIVGVLRIVFIDEEALHFGLILGRDGGVVLHDVVGVQITFHSRSHALEEDGSLVLGDGRVVMACGESECGEHQCGSQQLNH